MKSARNMFAFLHAGVTADYSTNLTTADHIKFNTVSGSVGTFITLDTTTAYTNTQGVASIGRFTLQPNFTYKLTGAFSADGSSASAGVIWHNSTTNASFGLVGGLIAGGATATRQPQPLATATIAPTVVTLVELRFIATTSITTLEGNTVAQNSTWAYIELLNGSNTR